MTSTIGGFSLITDGERLTTLSARGLGRAGAYLELAMLVVDGVWCVSTGRRFFCWAAKIADGFNTGGWLREGDFSDMCDDWELVWLALVLSVSID